MKPDEKCPCCGEPMSKDLLVIEVLKLLKGRGLDVKIKGSRVLILNKWSGKEDECYAPNYWGAKSTIGAIYRLLKSENQAKKH